MAPGTFELSPKAVKTVEIQSVHGEAVILDKITQVRKTTCLPFIVDDVSLLVNSRAYPGALIKHLLKHILKSKHLWKERLRSENPRIIVKLASEIASQTGEYIAEKKQTNGNTMKCDARTGLVVIVKPDAASDTGHSIETAFMVSGRVDSYLHRKLR